MDSIVEAVAKWAAQRPERAAVIAEGQQITYEELWKEVRGFAAYLRSMGLKKGDRVVVKARNDIWYAVSCYGIHLAGCVHVPLEKTIEREGMRTTAEQLSPSLLISDIPVEGAAYPTVDSARVRDLAREHFDKALHFDFPRQEELCDILFTTGTTGKSKGVNVSHRAQVALVENVKYGMDMPSDNRFLAPNPINHAAGIRNLNICMFMGTTAILLDGYTDIKAFFAYIRDYRVTGIYMPPSAVRMILLLAGKELTKYADQIQYVHTSSAPFPEADRERLRELLPNTKLYITYGCSEAGRACVIEYSSSGRGDICVGKPTVHTRVLIVDDDRNEIQSSVNNQGLIAIAGDTVMEGYYNDPELTARTLVGGVVYTNDIGYIDGEGYLYVMGRRDDVINVGGLKLAPTEVEGVALWFPGVAECVCYPVKDKFSGVSPKMNIVEEPGADVDTAALREYMLQHLEAFKVPKQFEKVDAVPKTANGKIDRKVYKDANVI